MTSLRNIAIGTCAVTIIAVVAYNQYLKRESMFLPSDTSGLTVKDVNALKKASRIWHQRAGSTDNVVLMRNFLASTDSHNVRKSIMGSKVYKILSDDSTGEKLTKLIINNIVHPVFQASLSRGSLESLDICIDIEAAARELKIFSS